MASWTHTSPNLTASRSVHWFSRFRIGLAVMSNRPRYMCSNRPHVCSLCMRCSLAITKWSSTRQHVLSSFEGEREVGAPVLGTESREVERVRAEMVNERAERQAVSPRRRKVGHVHVLHQVQFNSIHVK